MVRMLWSLVALATFASVPACSILNREGPDVTCADLSGGSVNACKEGIIASCKDGKAVTYEVCLESTTCDETWQRKGAYKCSQSNPSRTVSSQSDPSPTVSLANVQVDEDSNGDGVLSPGETGTLLVFVKNTGATKVAGLYGALTTPPMGLQILGCYAGSSYGERCPKCSCADVGSSSLLSVVPGQKASVLAIRVQVPPQAPVGPIPFGVTLFDDAGRSWPLTATASVDPSGATAP
ncbi:MAG: hypothetical protein IT374_18555 [Polyangiaceae bacterium]|nr:hypothetical protein [Polyangiaceae bacterium]